MKRFYFILAFCVAASQSYAQEGEGFPGGLTTHMDFPDMQLWGHGPEAHEMFVSPGELGLHPKIHQPPPKQPEELTISPQVIIPLPKPPAVMQSAQDKLQKGMQLRDKVLQIKQNADKIPILLKILSAVILPHEAALLYASWSIYDVINTAPKEEEWWKDLLSYALDRTGLQPIYDSFEYRSVHLGEIFDKDYFPYSVGVFLDPDREQMIIDKTTKLITPELMSALDQFGSVRVWNNCKTALVVRIVFMQPGGVWVYGVIAYFGEGEKKYVKYGSNDAVTNNRQFYVYAESDSPYVFAELTPIVFGSPLDQNARDLQLHEGTFRFASRLSPPLGHDHTFNVT